MKLSPRNCALSLALVVTLVAPLCGQTSSSIYSFAFDQDHLNGAPDFSFLNHSLATADRIFVKNGHFYTVGADLRPDTSDDQRVRFFGVSMTFSACFPDTANGDAQRIAKRLRRLGFNLVRLHSMDATLDASGTVCTDTFTPATPTQPASIPKGCDGLLTTDPYPSFNDISIARLRNFLNAFKNEGIYVDLVLHAGYTFRPGVDPVPASSGAIPGASRPLSVFYPEMVTLQQRFAQQLISKLHLQGDPVLAMVEINNESSMVFALKLGLLDQARQAGDYNTAAQTQWNAWLSAKYKTTAALVKAWGVAPPSGQSLELGNVQVPEPIDKPTQAIQNDYGLFLTTVDQTFFNAIRDTVRAGTDALVPITGTQANFGGFSLYDSQSGLDYLDNHFYVDHADFPHGEWNQWDWRIRNAALADSAWSGFVDLAWARQAGRPYTVSEYSEPWPNTHAAECDLSYATFASFQDWDAIMHFAYSSERYWDIPLQNFYDVNGDWTKFAALGQSAWLFRTGAVRPSGAPLSVPITADQRLQDTVTRSLPAVDIVPPLGVPREAALTRAVQMIAVPAGQAPPTLPKDATSPVSSPYVSDTGELTFDATRKQLLVNAPLAAAINGNIGAGKKQTSGPIDVELPASGRDFATVLVTARDNRPIPQSGSLLVSVPGYSFRSLPGPRETGVPGSNPPQAPAGSPPQLLVNYFGDPNWWTLDPTNSLPTWGTWVGKAPPSGNMGYGYPPVFLERVECWLTLRTSATWVSVAVLDGAGSVAGTLPGSEVEAVSGGFRIHLNGEVQAQSAPFSPWFSISATQRPASRRPK